MGNLCVLIGANGLSFFRWSAGHKQNYVKLDAMSYLENSHT